MLAELEYVGIELAALDASAHSLPISAKLRAVPDGEFASACCARRLRLNADGRPRAA